jgi:2-succinyl-6-hydroxy-2,4-cyclohexadiene-1-carboxylate synthase
MARLPVGGVQINVETAGAGDPLVLLHGFTGSAATWEPHMSELARGFFTVAIDHLGHGQSDAPADPERYAIGFAAEDILSVLDQLHIDRAHVLGYSMGGRVALALAIIAPERLSALILESASPGLPAAEARRERGARDAALAASIERDGVEAFADRWERLPLFASQTQLPDDVRSRLRAQRLRNTPAGLANSLRGLGQGVQAPMHEYLPEVRIPTLVLAGALDPDYCERGREMNRLIPGARLEIVPDAGHAIHLEQPEAFRRLVLEFLDRRSRAEVKT